MPQHSRAVISVRDRVVGLGEKKNVRKGIVRGRMYMNNV